MIRPLTPEDASAYVALRAESLAAAPFAFAAAPEDDRAGSVDFMRSAFADPTQRAFGAFAPGLVGAVGVHRGRGKAAHKAHVWGMYVQAAHRGQGLGRELMRAAIAFAQSLPGVTHLHLGVSERAPEARALYEKLGFVIWGTEPSALRVNGIEVAEYHMVLSLGAG